MNIVDIVMIITLILTVFILFLTVLLAKRRCVISSENDLEKAILEGENIIFSAVEE